MDLLVWDIDGTLVDASATEEEAFLSALRDACGVTSVSCDWNTYENRTDTGIVYEILKRHHGRAPTNAETTAVLSAYVANLRDAALREEYCAAVAVGARDLLTSLRAAGRFVMALSSGSIEESAALKLRHTRLENFFVAGAYSNDSYERAKILQRSIQKAEIAVGCQFPSLEVCFIGDQVCDARAAQSLGVRFVGITENEDRARQMLRLGALRVFPGYQDANGILDTLSQ